MSQFHTYKLGMRVRVNDTFPYGYSGATGTIIGLPYRWGTRRNDSGEWLRVALDGREHPAEWHHNYFDVIEAGDANMNLAIGQAPWDLEGTIQLVILRAFGLSAGQIAKHLEITRNAVIGKIYRLGLGARRSAICGIGARNKRSATPK